MQCKRLRKSYFEITKNATTFALHNKNNGVVSDRLGS